MTTLLFCLKWLINALCLACVGLVTNFTDRVRVNEFLKWEVDQRFCRDAQTIKSTGTATLLGKNLLPGTPLKLVGSQYVVAKAADDASVVALFLGNDSSYIPEDLATNDITANKYQILVRGPALINADLIPTTDVDGGSHTLATILTALKTLNILPLREPPASGTGTQST